MPRAGLNETRVVQEAEQIADEVGLGRLTLTALADRLGVRQPSLYKHIDGLPGLHRAINVRAKIELAEVLARATVGRARGDAVTAVAYAYRGWAREHPGRYAAAQPAPAPGDTHDEAAAAAVIGVLTAVLTGYDLHGDDMIDAIRFLRAALHGFITLEAPTTRAFALPVDVDRSFDRLVRAVVNAVAAWTEPPTTPPRAPRKTPR